MSYILGYADGAAIFALDIVDADGDVELQYTASIASPRYSRVLLSPSDNAQEIIWVVG